MQWKPGLPDAAYAYDPQLGWELCKKARESAQKPKRLLFLSETMPNIAVALKSEIARVARKELKSEIGPLRKSNSQYRSEIAALKRRIAALESKVKAGAKRTKGKEAPAEDEAESGQKNLRFSAARFGAMRKKLNLSATQLAALLGVSALSVYKWEQGKARPRAAQLEAIAAMRGVGKREAQQRLEQLAQQ